MAPTSPTTRLPRPLQPKPKHAPKHSHRCFARTSRGPRASRRLEHPKPRAPHLAPPRAFCVTPPPTCHACLSQIDYTESSASLVQIWDVRGPTFVKPSWVEVQYACDTRGRICTHHALTYRPPTAPTTGPTTGPTSD
eukprot:scaffold16092_cov103-Phaeocystis_antarctica.AAC.4